jgi:glutamate-1-semialdehyde aminotransferase
MRNADAVRMKQISLEVFRQGFFLSGEKAYISLAHTDEDLDRTVDAFARAVGVATTQPIRS